MQSLQVLFLSILFTLSAAAFADIGLMKTESAAGSSNIHLNSESLDPASGQNQYDELEQMFSNSPAASETDILGWHSGRCFDYDTPSTPEAILLVGERREVGGDDGPLFPPRFETKILLLTAPIGKSANYFDDMTSDEEAGVQRSIENYLPAISEAQLVDGSLASDNEAGNLRFSLRKSAEYLISLSFLIKDGDNQKAGDNFSSCYFFKKVRN